MVLNNGGDGIQVEASHIDVSNSTITGHASDINAFFGSRLTLNGNTLGSIACDATVLSRGNTVCP